MKLYPSTTIIFEISNVGILTPLLCLSIGAQLNGVSSKYFLAVTSWPAPSQITIKTSAASTSTAEQAICPHMPKPSAITRDEPSHASLCGSTLRPLRRQPSKCTASNIFQSSLIQETRVLIFLPFSFSSQTVHLVIRSSSSYFRARLVIPPVSPWCMPSTTITRSPTLKLGFIE